MDNGFINLADIKVVPNFRTNDDLASSIWSILNSHLEKKNVIGNQPSQGPRFLVYRPSGRAGDEFKGHVTPHLKEGSPQYLIIASSTKPTDQFSISEDNKKRLHCHQTRVVINQGRLVASPENYHDYNSDSLKKLAEAICEDYSDFVEMRPVSRKPSVSSVLLKSMGTVFVITILYKLKKCLQDRALEMWTSEDSRETNKIPYRLDVMSKALKSGALLEEVLLQLSIKVLEKGCKTDESLKPVIPVIKQYVDQRMESPKKKSKVSLHGDSGSKGPPHVAEKEPNAKMTDKPVHETAQEDGQRDQDRDEQDEFVHVKVGAED